LEKKVNVSASENNFVTLVDDLLAKSENVKVFIAFLDPEVRHYIINQHRCTKPAFSKVISSACKYCKGFSPYI